MKMSESIKELATALSKAQAEMAGARKDANNPAFNSKYADLASVWDAARPSLSKNGLSVAQFTVPTEANEVLVETILMHASGEWMSGIIAIPVAKDNAHGYGSALTYARRYALAAAVGIAPEDDDGNKAADAPPTRPQPERKTPAGSARGVATAAFDALEPGEQESLRSKAQYVQELYAAKGIVDAVNALHDLNLDNEGKLAMWSLFDSEFRSTIKREEERRKPKLVEVA